MENPKELICKTEEEAMMAISKAGLTARVTTRDGQILDDTPGLVKSRVNLQIRGGIVTWAFPG